MTNINKEILVSLKKIGIDKSDALNVAEVFSNLEESFNSTFKESSKKLNEEIQSLKTKVAVLMAGYGFLIAVLAALLRKVI